MSTKKKDVVVDTFKKKLVLVQDKAVSSSKKLLSTPKVGSFIEKILKIFEPEYPASRSYRYLARQIETDYPVTDTGKSILFSSPSSMNSTSETILMFAYFLQSELDVNVLLVDASLRSDGLSSFLNISGQPGFLDVMKNDIQNVDSLIKHTRHHNISVLPSGVFNGKKVSDVSIKTTKVNTFLEYISSKYDYILLHQGSVISDTRYMLIAEQVDLVMMHAEEGGTFIQDLDDCRKKLRNHNVNNVRVILSTS